MFSLGSRLGDRFSSRLVSAGFGGSGPLSPRLVYDPAQPVDAAPVMPAPSPGTSVSSGRAPALPRPREVLDGYAGFYRDPLSWLVLAVTSIALCYGGGAVMFWYHAIHLREGGPQISNYLHWLLDSTVAFVALTPALFVLLPLASMMATRLAMDRRRARWLYVAFAGVAFALLTTPGPIVHDHLVGRGTWLATQVTQLVGDPNAPLRDAVEYGQLTEMHQQLFAALPLYVGIMAVSVILIRLIVHWAHRRIRTTAG
jgi:hypothetical protein